MAAIEQGLLRQFAAGQCLLDQGGDLCGAILGQRDIMAVAGAQPALRRRVEHVIGQALQRLDLVAGHVDTPRAFGRGAAEQRQPLVQRRDMGVGLIGAGDDRVGALAKLGHQRGDFRHGQAQLVDMGADVAAALDIRLHPTDQMAGIAVELAKLAADRGRGFGRLFGEPADFLRHHGKAHRRLAAARRLDRGIDAKQAGLAGDRSKLVGNTAHRFDHLQELAQMAFQAGDMLDQPRHLAQRQGDDIMPLGNDAPGSTGSEAEFLGRRHALILAGGQRLHVRLQVRQARRIALDPAVHFAQKSSGFAALQCYVARPFAQVSQQFPVFQAAPAT